MDFAHLQKPLPINVCSEWGHLNAVLLHRPGVEIERMTPENAHHALYSDILNKPIVDTEYANFSGVFERFTTVYYVQDILAHILKDDAVRQQLLQDSCTFEGGPHLLARLSELDADTLARVLIEGFPFDRATQPDLYYNERYWLKPLYNLFFTRDASSSVYNRVLINTMSFDVRQRETLIYRAIFEHFFHCPTLCAGSAVAGAHTEGGDVQIASPNLLCLGQGIRTNRLGAEYLIREIAPTRERFAIILQELPHEPESFIHLDMVFTFLGQHQCMIYEPLLRKTGLFANCKTYILTLDGDKPVYQEYPNILAALHTQGIDLDPVICGGSDPWNQQREQWHSGANFFALDDGKIIGYARNTHTIEALNNAGFAVLPAEDVCAGRINMDDYSKFVVTFKGSELPRGGGGARCMTMPINRN